MTVTKKISVAAALVFIPAAILLAQFKVDRLKERFDRENWNTFIAPNPLIIKTLSLGYHGVIADIYWLRAIQYYSDSVDHQVPPEKLYPMTDFITDLDPRFCVPFYYSGLNMAMGKADPDHTRAILEKGIRLCPEEWKIHFVLGYHLYFNLGKYQEAADQLDEAYRRHGQQNLALLASRIRAEGGRPELAIRFLTEMISNTEDPEQKKRFESRIHELQAKIYERELSRAVDIYRQHKGAYPNQLLDLVNEGILRGIPRHPVSPKHKFALDRASGTVVSEPMVDIGVHVPPTLPKPAPPAEIPTESRSEKP